MEILIAAIIFVGLAVLIMCFNIIFRNKPFPDSEIGHSNELRKRGIVCAKEEEMKLWGPKRGGAATCDGASCSDCGLNALGSCDHHPAGPSSTRRPESPATAITVSASGAAPPSR